VVLKCPVDAKVCRGPLNSFPRTTSSTPARISHKTRHDPTKHPQKLLPHPLCLQSVPRGQSILPSIPTDSLALPTAEYTTCLVAPAPPVATRRASSPASPTPIPRPRPRPMPAPRTEALAQLRSRRVRRNRRLRTRCRPTSGSRIPLAHNPGAADGSRTRWI
jgi:hypothetical protein